MTKSKSKFSEIRLATPKDLERILETEKAAFVNEPHETIEGLRFIMERGHIFIMPGTGAITELIPTESLLDADIQDLSPESPLRMLIENDLKSGVLRNVTREFDGRRIYYRHGTVVPASHRNKGYGSFLIQESDREILSPDDVVVSYVMADPPNLPSIRMHFKTNGDIDKLEGNIHEQDISYFRIVHNARIKVRDEYTIQITIKDDYINSVRYLL